VDELSFLAGTSADLTRWGILSDGLGCARRLYAAHPGSDLSGPRGQQWPDAALAKLTIFAGIHGKTYEECLPQLRKGIQDMLANPTSDGACFHELANAYYLDLWQEGIADVYSLGAESGVR